MTNFILKNENAVYYECGYSCDNEIFIFANGKKFFISDARYEIEAKQRLKDTEFVLAKDSVINTARLLLRKLSLKNIIADPKDFTLHEFNNLSEFLGIDFILKENFSQQKRIIKSSHEIKLLKKAAIKGAKAFDLIAKFMRENKSLNELKINHEAQNILKENGKLDLSFTPITAINKNAAKAHAIAQKDKIKKNDLFLLDAGVKYKRYCSDRTRTACFGKNFNFAKEQKFKSSKQNEVYEIVKTAQNKTIKAIKPGILARDIDFIARDFIKKAGFGEYFSHSTGHGVGLDIHELPIISPKSQTIIKEGMVFSVEPGIYLENEFGVRIEDVVVVTKNGCEIL